MRSSKERLMCSAIFSWNGAEQWFLSDRIIGYGEVLKPCSAMACGSHAE